MDSLHLVTFQMGCSYYSASWENEMSCFG